MGYITIAMIALIAIALIFGMLFGIIRGFKRSFLRLILVAGCVAGAVFLRETAVNFVLEMDAVKQAMNSVVGQLPQTYQKVVLVLVSIVLSVIVYFALFFALRLISWLILFPLLKIVIKRERSNLKFLGAIIGLIQGAVIAFAVLVPLNGLIIQVEKISNIKFEMPASGQDESVESSQGPKALFELPKELGLKEYTESAICITLTDIGGWYFDMLTTVKTETGNLNFNDVSDMTVGVADILASTTVIQEGFEKVMKEETTNEEKSQTFKELGAKISGIGGNFDQMSDDAKAFMDDLISSSLGESGVSANISVEELKLDSLGEAFTSLGNYYDDEQVNQTEANQIVNAIVENWSVIESVYAGGTENGTLIDMEGDNEELFRNAINELADDSQKEKIMEMFGVVVPA